MTDTATKGPKRKVHEQPITERDAREVTEEARETEWADASFLRELFLGDLRMDLIHPHPRPDPESARRTDEFLADLREFLEQNVDGERIEETGRIPQEVIDGLRDLGAFGIKISPEYGGLGLSQRGYNKAMALTSTANASIGVLLSAHQSIGVSQPLKMFGSDEQKREYLPRVAAGEISAFALTEPDVGSDPARMRATADPTDDGEAFVLNGEKLWTTNGPIADVMVVMARTPVTDGGRRPITAFIVEADWDGVEPVHRCEFMGLRGIENGIIRFNDVRVPRENVLWEEGRGLKLALVTLNTGRLTIPAQCAAAGKWCLQVARWFAGDRKQWGAPIGKHDAIAQKIGGIAARTFAMEAVTELAAALADTGGYDIRLEAAVAKMFNSETAWWVADETMQIRGGRGYETARSLEARGEPPLPVERVLRDLRINTIFEGSSEIMRLFIAREALDPHLERAGALVDPDSDVGEKAKSVAGLGAHMARWVSGNTVGWGRWPRYSEFGPLASHVRYADRASRKLARTLAMAMARFGPGLEKKQSVLFRLVDVGAEIFAMAATCSRARMLTEDEPGNEGPNTLADLFCRGAERRIEGHFERVFDNDDALTYDVARQVLDGEHRWLESGILDTPVA